MAPAKTHPSPEDGNGNGSVDPPDESKRQISERSSKTARTVEMSDPGEEPVPPSPPPPPHTPVTIPSTPVPSTPPSGDAVLAMPAPVQRHATVDEELGRFKSLSARRHDSGNSSDSQPGAHHVEGPHLDSNRNSNISNNRSNHDDSGNAVVEDRLPRNSSSAAAAEDSEEGGGGGDTSIAVVDLDDPFAEPYNVPSAYVVDEEQGEARPEPPLPLQTVVPITAPVVPAVSAGNVSSDVVVEELKDDEERSSDSNKGGCTMKLPCCLCTLTTPFLVAIAILGIIAAIVVVVLGAHYAGEEGDKQVNTTKTQLDPIMPEVEPPQLPDVEPTEPVEPVEPVDPNPDIPVDPGIVIDIGDIDFTVPSDDIEEQDGGGDTEPLEPDPEPVDPEPEVEPVDPEQEPVDPDLEPDPIVEVCNVWNNGGCDPLTTCTDTSSGRECGPCPTGYIGNGVEGCQQVIDPDEPGPTMPIPEVLTDCKWQKLLAIDGAPDKRFGQNVAIEGDLLAISAPKDDESRGSVYVYERTLVSICCWSIWYEPPPKELKWKYQAKLTASDSEPGDSLMFPDISGKTIAVGAKKADVDGKKNMGAVYVWARSSDRQWVEEAKLVADDGREGDYFGNNLSLDGDVLIVAARLHDAGHEDSGAAYVFRRNNGQWDQEQKIVPNDGQAFDEFGSRIELQGNRALISAYKSDDNGKDSGSVYVWRYNGRIWKQDAKLVPDDGAEYDLFGVNVAMDDKTIVVGAYNDTELGVTEEGAGAGAAYIFRRSAGVWSQSAKILAKDGEMGHHFGRQVSVNGNVMIISSLSNFLLPDSGAIYVFRKVSETEWQQQSKLMTKHSIEDSFGSDVALDGLTILAGARYDTDNGYRSGSAYIIELC